MENESNSETPASDFISYYLALVKNTEPPYVYHRWCALAGIAALLGRQYYLRFGNDTVWPNLYCVLIGEPGTRKSTAIRSFRRIVMSTGYSTIAPDRTSKEKFLLDLQGEAADLDSAPAGSSYDKTTAANLWLKKGSLDGEEDSSNAHEMFITADELNEFLGTNNTDFCRMLGQLWDYEGAYKNRIKNGLSVSIMNPTINILGGTTPQDFASTFPPELIGQGFLSRLILIRGETSGRKFTFPEGFSDETKVQLSTLLKAIQHQVRGCATITPEATALLDKIYNEWTDLPDVRFRHYSNRRFTQLLKLCLICSAAQCSTTIRLETVVQANTFLAAAEAQMPEALGEFGKGKLSASTDKIMRALQAATRPLDMKDLWREVHKDLDKPQDLATILQSLEQADKLHHVKSGGTAGKGGWLPKAVKQRKVEYVDWSILTVEERKGL